MGFKLISKDKLNEKHTHSEQIDSSFKAKDEFLYYRGVKIAKCKFPSIFKEKKLFVIKEDIVETYRYDDSLNMFKYDVDQGVLRVFDEENNVLKIFTFDKISETNDGILLKGNRTLYLKNSGEEEEIDQDFDTDDTLLGYSAIPFVLYSKREVKFASDKETPNHKIDLPHNILKPEIFIEDHVYTIKDKQEEKDCLFSQIPNDECFLVKKTSKERVFNKLGRLLLYINGVFLCEKSVVINSIIMISKFTIEDRTIEIIVTNRHIFMMYEDFISYKEHSDIIYHIGRETSQHLVPVAYTIDGKIDLNELYLTLSLFTELPKVSEGLEKFLFDLFIFTNLSDKFISKIIKLAGLETVLCNIYRLVDDKNKRIIDKFILKESLIDISNIKKILIFHQHLIPDYIKRCVEEQKEYEIEDLIEHYKDSTILKTIALELMNYNCFYLFTLCYPDYEEYFDLDILKIEKYNLMSQRNRKA
ncbi:hypothetical protein NGRA_1625 [Nosema granulosis]|uniref:Uncharacterized protein n=1 Tax=Nosema granulosis TaxID=83296 RepID=A0A9P6GZ40_9MICR|nr:hypothetical protein NGRA_1625 [Nosema granulosis]